MSILDFSCSGEVREKFVVFSAAGDSSDLLCTDGELIGAEKYFPAGDGGADDSGDSGDENPGGKDTVLRPAKVGVLARVTDELGAPRLLCVHRGAEGAESPLRFIFQLPSGELAYLREDEPWKPLSVFSGREETVRSAVACGDWLVAVAGGEVLYSKVSGEGYTPLSPVPEMPEVGYSLVPARLQGYSVTEDSLPEVLVSLESPADLDQDIRSWLAGGDTGEKFYSSDFKSFRQRLDQEISKAWSDYRDAAEAAGLFVTDVVAAPRLVLDGETLESSAPEVVAHPDVSLQVRISSANVGSGYTRLVLLFSRRPMKLVPSAASLAGDETWEGMALSHDAAPLCDAAEPSEPGPLRVLMGVDADQRRCSGWYLSRKTAVEREKERLAALEALTQPDHRLAEADGAILFNSRLIVYGGNQLRVSVTDHPAATAAVSRMEGGRILGISYSFRALSSGQFGDFPLYLFSSDGVRAVTPDDAGFRTVQLISRDVPLPSASPVAATGAVLVATERGLVSIEGTTAKVLGHPVAGRNWMPAYHYASETAIALRSDMKGVASVYDFSRKKWDTSDLPALQLCESWPDLWGMDASGNLFRVEAVAKTEEESAVRKAVGAGVAGIITSRPIKLGEPMRPKKLIEAIMVPSEGGDPLPFNVEGSNDLRNWHLLCRAIPDSKDRAPKLLAATGRLRLPPFRYFRLRLFAGDTLPAGILLRYRVASRLLGN